MRIALVVCSLSLSVLVLVGCMQPNDPVIIVEGGDYATTTIVFAGDEPAPLYDGEGQAAVQDLGFVFARVGVRFTADSSEAIELLSAADGSTWSGWAKPLVYFSDENVHAGHLDVVGAPRLLQHRVTPGAGVESS